MKRFMPAILALSFALPASALAAGDQEHPESRNWSWNGIFGTYAREQLEMGDAIMQKSDRLMADAIETVAALYTDGIIEAMDANQEPFGKDRLKDLVRECRDLPARESVTRIKRAVIEFVGTDRQEDDFTLVLARMT